MKTLYITLLFLGAFAAVIYSTEPTIQVTLWPTDVDTEVEEGTTQDFRATGYIGFDDPDLQEA